MRRRRFAFRFLALALVLPFVLASTVVVAQDKSVERIRQLYEDVGKRIDLSEKGIEESHVAGIFCNELTFNKNKHIWPVVGNFEMIYKFYYELANTEGHEYPDRLRMVVMKASMSDRSYYDEFLFDDAGSLVFYLTRPSEPQVGDDLPRAEHRFYFLRGRPVTLINGQKINYSLTPQETAIAKDVVKTSREIKGLFAASISVATD